MKTGKAMGLLMAAFLVVLTGCSGPSLTDYASRDPKLVPEQFFTGELFARGIVKDMSDQTTMSKWGVEVGELVLVIQKK